MSYSDHQKSNPTSLISPCNLSKICSRPPSELTIRTEGTTKSKKRWKFLRMDTDGKLRATLTRMTSGRKKIVKKDVPAVPELPTSAFQKQQNVKVDGNRQMPTGSHNAQSPHLSDGMKYVKSKFDDNCILEPPVPAFLETSKRRNSSHSSLTSNSESGSEFGSEGSFSAYSMSTINSPLYVKSDSSSQVNFNVILDRDLEEGAESTSNGDTIKSFGSRSKDRKMQMTFLSSSGPSASSARFATDTHPITLDPFRASTFFWSKETKRNTEKDLYALNVKDTTLQEKQRTTDFHSNRTSERKQIKYRKPTFQNDANFTRSSHPKAENLKHSKNSNFHHMHSVYSGDSDGQSGIDGSTLTSLPCRVRNTSPQQSPMLSPATLLRLSPPISPLRSSGGLTTSGRKALYSCTVQKLYPQIHRLDARGTNASAVAALKSPRSMNNFKTLQTHPSTSSHFRNLAILLARTKVTIRLKTSILTIKEEDEIKEFVGKGYLDTYLCPQEVACRTQNANSFAHADTLTKSPLLSSSEKTVKENGMTAWIKRKPFVERMKLICSKHDNDELKPIPRAIEADLFRGLHFSQRSRILGFGDGIERPKARITLAKHAISSTKGVNKKLVTNPAGSASRESLTFLNEDDIPLALLKKKRSKSATLQNEVNIDGNDVTKRMNENKQYGIGARSRRDQSDQYHHFHLTSQPHTLKSKAGDAKLQTLQNKREDRMNASFLSGESVKEEMGICTENKVGNAKSLNLERTTIFIPAMQPVATVQPQPMLMTRLPDHVQMPVIYGIQSVPARRVLFPMPFTVQMEPLLPIAPKAFPGVHREAHRFSSRNTPKRSPLSQNVFNA